MQLMLEDGVGPDWVSPTIPSITCGLSSALTGLAFWHTSFNSHFSNIGTEEYDNEKNNELLLRSLLHVVGGGISIASLPYFYWEFMPGIVIGGGLSIFCGTLGGIHGLAAKFLETDEEIINRQIRRVNTLMNEYSTILKFSAFGGALGLQYYFSAP